jgi:hypothetical protein
VGVTVMTGCARLTVSCCISKSANTIWIFCMPACSGVPAEPDPSFFVPAQPTTSDNSAAAQFERGSSSQSSLQTSKSGMAPDCVDSISTAPYHPNTIRPVPFPADSLLSASAPDHPIAAPRAPRGTRLRESRARRSARTAI